MIIKEYVYLYSNFFSIAHTQAGYFPQPITAFFPQPITAPFTQQKLSFWCHLHVMSGGTLTVSTNHVILTTFNHTHHFLQVTSLWSLFLQMCSGYISPLTYLTLQEKEGGFFVCDTVHCTAWLANFTAYLSCWVRQLLQLPVTHLTWKLWQCRKKRRDDTVEEAAEE